MAPPRPPSPLRPPGGLLRRSAARGGLPRRLVAVGALAAALATVGRALWLRAAARRFARLRGPRFAAVSAPRPALPAGAVVDGTAEEGRP